jgi:hypothetical protein
MTEPQKMPKPEVLETPPITRRKPPEAAPRPARRANRRRPAEDSVTAAADPSVPEDDAVGMEDAELNPFMASVPVIPANAGRSAVSPETADTETGPRPGNIHPGAEVDKDKSKSAPPTVDEWQDFIGRIVLRTALDGYMTLMLRDCDLTAQEEKYLELTKQDYKEMSAPFAGFANKNKTLRKHGRAIVSAADSWEAIVALSIWLRRVNKVARRHRSEIAASRQEKQAIKRARVHQHGQPPVQTPNPASSGFVDPQTLAERSVNGNGTTGPVQRDGDAARRPAPPPPGATFNPGSG